MVPVQSDIVVVGGGLIGWASAFWLRHLSSCSVTLIERDPSYKNTPSFRGLGGLHTQFVLPENIQMSRFAAQFIRQMDEFLTPFADQQAQPMMKESLYLQRALDCVVEDLKPDEIAHRWPWMNTKDVSLGVRALEEEGWFDNWALLQALRAKSHDLGVNYVIGDVYQIDRTDSTITYTSHGQPERQPVTYLPIREAHIRLPNRDTAKITFHTMVNAAGCWAKELAELAGIGGKDSPLPLPVERALQHVFLVQPPPELSDDVKNCPTIDAPFIHDYTGLVIQRHGLSGDFAVYVPLTEEDVVNPDVPEDQLPWLHKMPADVVQKLYAEKIKPLLVNRIPIMQSALLRNAWTSYDYINTFDGCPVVGRHPFQRQMLFALASSGAGAQHSLGIGRAVAEIVFNDVCQTIDLSGFAFERFLYDRHTMEINTR